MKKIFVAIIFFLISIELLSAASIATDDLMDAYQKNGTVKFQKGFIGPYRYHIGAFAQGGVIIWLTDDRRHGLVAAIEDVRMSSLMWSSQFVTTHASYQNPLPSSTPDFPFGHYYAGYQNQKTIVDNFDLNDYPAFHASVNYSITINGKTYDDWFLPGNPELSQMYNTQDIINQVSLNHGGEALRTDVFYWSSYEVSQQEGAVMNFVNHQFAIAFKNSLYAARCVRAF